MSEVNSGFWQPRGTDGQFPTARALEQSAPGGPFSQCPLNGSGGVFGTGPGEPQGGRCSEPPSHTLPAGSVLRGSLGYPRRAQVLLGVSGCGHPVFLGCNAQPTQRPVTSVEMALVLPELDHCPEHQDSQAPALFQLAAWAAWDMRTSGRPEQSGRGPRVGTFWISCVVAFS